MCCSGETIGGGGGGGSRCAGDGSSGSRCADGFCGNCDGFCGNCDGICGRRGCVGGVSVFFSRLKQGSGLKADYVG